MDVNYDSEFLKKENLNPDEYKIPEQKDVFINAEEKEEGVKEIKDLTPWERIKIVAQKNNIKIQNPNPNCTKPGCYGRGYIGTHKDTSMPVPCVCIFSKEDRKKLNENKQPILNYKGKRRIKLLMNKKSYKKRIEKEKLKEDKKIKNDLIKAGTELAKKKKEKCQKDEKII